jgi:orotidine-5'-phosphate decarboxylase
MSANYVNVHAYASMVKGVLTVLSVGVGPCVSMASEGRYVGNVMETTFVHMGSRNTNAGCVGQPKD